MTKTAREFDIIVYGATGFSGQLLAEYLVKNYFSKGTKLALGGRSQQRLEKVRANVEKINPAAGNLPIIIADGGDLEALTNMAKQARCVATTVGPYFKYGNALVEACAKSGTSYCDLTGENNWSATMFNKWEHTAKKSGARIVHQAGFDSVPSDIGAMVAARTFREKYGRDADSIEMFVSIKGGGIQGGTIDTVMEELINGHKLRKLKKETGKAAGAPKRPSVGKTKLQHAMGIHYNKRANLWAVPFFMAVANMPQVAHSNGRLGYSKDMTYAEYMSFRSFFPAFAMYCGLIIFGALLVFPPTRWLLQKFVLPAPGQGPTKAECEAASYKVKFVATSGSDQVDVLIDAVGDASCISTTCCLAESAMSLSVDADKLDSDAGVTTTAAAMGDVLLGRLNATPLFNIRVAE